MSTKHDGLHTIFHSSQALRSIALNKVESLYARNINDMSRIINSAAERGNLSVTIPLASDHPAQPFATILRARHQGLSVVVMPGNELAIYWEE